MLRTSDLSLHIRNEQEMEGGGAQSAGSDHHRDESFTADLLRWKLKQDRKL